VRYTSGRVLPPIFSFAMENMTETQLIHSKRLDKLEDVVEEVRRTDVEKFIESHLEPVGE
jgi:hypothetical protein